MLPRLLVPALLFVCAQVHTQDVPNAEPLQCLVDGAREQIGLTLSYDPSYQRLQYPGGDVALASGVCTDVLVRAYRALGVDLQVLVHEDMRAHFSAYPRNWGLTTTDRNIDHRRVPNLARFFTRHGQSFASDSEDAGYLAGDLVTWRLPSGVPHIGIVSDRQTGDGRPLVVHNIGAGAVEEDMLRAYEITGHYRWRPRGLPAECKSKNL